MPVKFRVVLLPERTLRVEELFPDRLHGLFFSLLGEDLAGELHNYRTKPFSLSFYYQKDGKRKPLLGVKEAQDKEASKLLIEISFLRDELFPRFLSNFMLDTQTSLRLGEVKLRKLRKPLLSERDLSSYENILKNTPQSDRITLGFLTPTTFRRGKADYPLPDPKLILKGLIKKWHTFSEIKIETDLREAMDKKIKVAGAWIGTERVDFSNMGFMTGFKGRVILSLDDLSPEEKAWVCRLIRFSEFAGVGRKTTMGFGKVRVLEEQ